MEDIIARNKVVYLSYSGAVCLGLMALPAAGAQPKPAAQPGVEIPCPPTIGVEQRANAVPQGWEAAEEKRDPRLESVTFFDGPPSERASLKYDREEKQKREWVATWNLPASARGYWIACHYERTTVSLSRRLPGDVKTCQVTYERRVRGAAGLPAIKRIECK